MLTRKTRETDIQLELALDGTGEYEVATGIPFFDHMLESFAKHAAFDLRLRANGDLAVDLHHTVEDVGIALGQALREALGDARGHPPLRLLRAADGGVEASRSRSTSRTGPTSSTRSSCSNDRIGDFDVSLVEDFLYAFSQNAGLDLHVELRYGKSPHHVVEAVFKGLARALRAAVELDPRITDVPSVKGTL